MTPPSAGATDGAPSGSASAIVTGAVSGYHMLRIEGYSRTKSTVPNGKCVESRPFRVGGRTWAIEYHPNGDRSECADYLSLYLVLKDPTADGVMVHFEFSFIDQVEKQDPSRICNLTALTFDASNTTWGYKKFFKEEDLEHSDRLKNDCFTVRCDLIISGKPRAEDTTVPATSFVVVPPPDWPQHFRELLHGGQGADVTFQVGGDVFTAHRCVLAARSPVFSAQLFRAMKEGTATEDCIRIDDMLPRVFKSLLHFIYTDSLVEIEGQDDATAAAMVHHLLEAADRYDMKRFKLICEDRLCRHIDVSTVATTLALAEQHHCQGLKEACLDFLKCLRTLKAAMATNGFQHLAKSCPSLLFELISMLAARCIRGADGSHELGDSTDQE